MSRYNLSAKENKSVLRPTNEKAGPVKLEPEGEGLTLAVAFGFDHALGVFFGIYTPAASEEEEELAHVEASSRFDGVTKSHLLEVIEYYASEEEKLELVEVRFKIAMDVPF